MTKDSSSGVTLKSASMAQELLRRVANGELSAKSAKALLSRPVALPRAPASDASPC